MIWRSLTVTQRPRRAPVGVCVLALFFAWALASLFTKILVPHPLLFLRCCGKQGVLAISGVTVRHLTTMAEFIASGGQMSLMVAVDVSAASLRALPLPVAAFFPRQAPPFVLDTLAPAQPALSALCHVNSRSA